MSRALPIALLLALLPRAACAQRLLELSGGYSLARDPRDDVTLPGGWFVGAALGVTPAVALVADVSGQYKTIPLLQSDARLTVHSVMGGLRGSARVGRLTESAQIVAGVVHTSGSAFGATTVERTLAIQPGVSIDYPLTRRWAVRAALDVRVMRGSDVTRGAYQYRFATGVVYRVRPR